GGRAATRPSHCPSPRWPRACIGPYRWWRASPRGARSRKDAKKAHDEAPSTREVPAWLGAHSGAPKKSSSGMVGVMPVEIGMWRIDDGRPRRLGTSVLPSEATLESFLEEDPSLLGERLLVIGRQVRTPHG